MADRSLQNAEDLLYEPGMIRRLTGMLLPALFAVVLAYGTVVLAQMMRSYAAGAEYGSVTKDAAEYIGAVITERGYIPYLELFFFWLALLSLLRRYLARRREKGLFYKTRAEWQRLRDEVKGDAPAISANCAEATVNALSGMNAKLLYSKTGRRIFLAVRRFEKTRSSKEVDDVLATMSDMDASAVESSYTNVRYLIWLIPTLGFIGTVIGVGMGVSGFGMIIEGASSFGDVQDALPAVTHNLGIAFDTTLVALFLTAIVLAAMSYTQKREEDLLAHIDTFCIEEIAGSFEESDAFSEQIRGSIAQQTQSLGPYIKSGVEETRKLNQTMSQQLSAIQQLIQEQSKTRQATQESVAKLQEVLQRGDRDDSLRETLEQLQETAKDTAAQIGSDFAGLKDGMEEISGKLAGVTEELRQYVEEGGVQDAMAFTKAVEELRTGIAPITDAVGALTSASEKIQGLSDLSGLAEALVSVADNFQKGGEGVHQAGTNFSKVGEELKEIIAGNKEVLQGVETTLETTTQSIKKLQSVIMATNEAIVAVQRAIQVMSES